MRIVRVANYVAPHSGGLRTSLRELGAGYLAAGHDPVLIIPGEDDRDEQTPQGRVITLSGPQLPFTGGYRALRRKRRVAALLSELRPDTLEVSDRTTLRWTGRWARERGVPAVMISHESLTALLRMAVPGLDLPALSRWGPALALVDWVNRRTARAYHPLRHSLERRATRDRLPVTFAGFLPDRTDLAALLASADVAIAPGPAETFGLAGLEALACGTPVVVSAESALPEVVGEAGAAVAGEDLSAGVTTVLSWPEAGRRAAARTRAERFGWPAAVQAFLAIHESLVEDGVEAGTGTRATVTAKGRPA